MSGTIDSLSVEVLAHLLQWTTEPVWLQVRGLNRKWGSAVCCLMEGELSRQTSTDGTWKPSQNSIARRLLLVCTPMMTHEVLQSVTCVNLDELRHHRDGWDPDDDYKDDRCVELAKMRNFTALETLRAAFFFGMTDKEFQEVAQLASLTSVEVHSGEFTDAGLQEMKLSSLTALDLSDTWITGTGLVTVAQLNGLRFLNLSCCRRIADAELKELLKLDSLTYLKLESFTQLTDLGLQDILRITSLTFLDLSQCSGITDIGLQGIAQLSALKSLSLAGCFRITDASLLLIANLASLEFLNLKYCTEITEIGLQAITKPRSLTSLNLQACRKIAVNDFCQLRMLHALTSLDISDCTSVTDSVLSALENLLSLQSLYLGGNPITDTGLSSIAKLRTVSVLDIHACVQISDAGLCSIARLGALTCLDLSFCTRVTDVGLHELIVLPALKFLHFRSCDQVTDAGLMDLLNIPTLTLLNVQRCDSISDAAIAEVRKRGITVRGI